MLIRTSYYPNEDYLAHFGIQGQKWGIRRYQYEDGSLTPEGRKHYGYGIEHPQNAGQYSMALNKADKVRAKTKVINDKNVAKIDKYVAKSDRAFVNGNINKAKKYSDKAEELVKNNRSNTEAYLAAKNEIDRLQKEAKDNGYEISSKDVIRQVPVGRHLVANLVGGPFGNVVVGVNDAYQLTTNKRSMESLGYAKGKKYNVKKQQKTESLTKPESKSQKNYQMYKNRVEGKSSTEFNKSPFKTYSKEEKSRAKSLAENEGRYNLDFIESIQNSKIMYDSDTKAINREYSKFLDDPEDYIFNKSEKLKQA